MIGRLVQPGSHSAGVLPNHWLCQSIIEPFSFDSSTRSSGPELCWLFNNWCYSSMQTLGVRAKVWSWKTKQLSDNLFAPALVAQVHPDRMFSGCSHACLRLSLRGCLDTIVIVLDTVVVSCANHGSLPVVHFRFPVFSQLSSWRPSLSEPSSSWARSESRALHPSLRHPNNRLVVDHQRCGNCLFLVPPSIVVCFARFPVAIVDLVGTGRLFFL